MVVQHNSTASNASRMLNITDTSISKTSEKLSSGFKINHAADDAAGLSISEKMRKQVRGLTRGLDNVEDGISFCQIADGALSEVNDMLNRMKELSIQSANGTNSPSDRQAINEEIQQLKRESERIFTTTTFNQRQIWERSPVSETVTKEIEYRPITFSAQSCDYKVTNENIASWPNGGFKLKVVEANEDTGEPGGLAFTWKSSDSTPVEYTSATIPWPNPETASQTLELANAFTDEQKSNSALKGVNCKIYYSTDSNTTIDEIKNYCKQVSVSASPSNSISTTITSNGGVTASASLSVYAIQNTNINLNGYSDTSFAEPNGMTSVDSSNGLTFTFDFTSREDPTKKIAVTTKPSTVTIYKYISSFDQVDRVSVDDQTLHYTKAHKNSIDENFSRDGWWGKYATLDVNGNFDGYQNYTLHYSIGSQNLKNSLFDEDSIKEILSGNYTKNVGNAKNVGGLMDDKNNNNENIAITFYYSMKDADGNNYGSFNVTVSGKEREGADSFINRIKAITNSDLFAGNSNSDGTSEGTGTRTSVQFLLNSVNDYIPKSTLEMTFEQLVGYEDLAKNIHSGPDSDMDEKLGIFYKCLSNFTIGLEDVDVLTIESSERAMGLIDAAAKMVVEQRSVFGAYQNRLEHTVKNLGNVAENTTAAESRIRDADMSGEMVKYSKDKILGQAGEAMLSQANTNANSVMNLLQ
ncbi:Flagellin FlgL [Pseudobutyrivibrio ruminis]|uniref:Flagellin n=1 Tax=Pseudobutyrivibrio ruminis TaxID=46206 RepID=A0A1H7LIC9_9FIRM|nr:flagellin [Pseudobutyrivibrio ruminis]SEK98666.1 Flagellin FlgL [Pseudobutyrivibrio ruminis]